MSTGMLFQDKRTIAKAAGLCTPFMLWKQIFHHLSIHLDIYKSDIKRMSSLRADFTFPLEDEPLTILISSPSQWKVKSANRLENFILDLRVEF